MDIHTFYKNQNFSNKFFQEKEPGNGVCIHWSSLNWFKFLVFPSHVAQPRKSYEFEDLLQSSSENNRVDWYAQTKLSLTRTLSEENVYEDILGKRPKW
jgi:hypothetical protein